MEAIKREWYEIPTGLIEYYLLNVSDAITISCPNAILGDKYISYIYTYIFLIYIVYIVLFDVRFNYFFRSIIVIGVTPPHLSHIYIYTIHSRTKSLVHQNTETMIEMSHCSGYYYHATSDTIIQWAHNSNPTIRAKIVLHGEWKTAPQKNLLIKTFNDSFLHCIFVKV